MFKELESIIKNIEGNVLSIALDNKLENYLYKNKSINLYTISDNSARQGIKTGKKRKTNKGKNINIKKLRKYINKKSVDYLFVNMDSLYKYYKYFIKDSIFLSRNMIYIYLSNNIDYKFIIDKYKRYNTKTEYKKYKDGYLIKIDNTKGANTYKDIIYFIKDTLYNIADIIGNILVS